jgi:hypothetical protein
MLPPASVDDNLVTCHSAEPLRGFRPRAYRSCRARHAMWRGGGMRPSATLRDLSQDQRKAVRTCTGLSLLKYQETLRYDRYLAEGFPIATGVIEGACRHLVEDRMDITGTLGPAQHRRDAESSGRSTPG